MSHTPPILFIVSGSERRSAADRILSRVRDALHVLGYETLSATSADDGLAFIESRPMFGAVVLDWGLPSGSDFPIGAAAELVSAMRRRSDALPIFLAFDRVQISDIPWDVAREVREYVNLLSETPEGTAQRIDFAVKQYLAGLFPPYFKALSREIDEGMNLWDAPGHQGGEAFRRHPVGNELLHLLGEGIFRADLGMQARAIGNWNEHMAPAESQRRASRIFGSDWTVYGVGGASAANRVAIGGLVESGDVVLVDRSCERSVTDGYSLAGARPVYLGLAANGYGMLSLAGPSHYQRAELQALVDHSAFVQDDEGITPSCASIRNSSADGLCYNVARLVQTLGRVVPRLHFDETAYAHAHFHPLYEGRHAMGVAVDDENPPTLVSVASAHSMLPALTMASMTHVRSSERAPVNQHVFRQSFMMHGTSTPFYPIIASLDVVTAMMTPPAGSRLVDDTMRDAVGFRQIIASTKRRVTDDTQGQGWFFDVFQPRRVYDNGARETYDLCDAPLALLLHDRSCWTLNPEEDWHGFPNDTVEERFCTLDPLKVTLLCPGIDASGNESSWGIPAVVIAEFLAERRTFFSRVGDYTLLVNFAVGAGPQRWGTLLRGLYAFKRMYDNGTTVDEAMPSVCTDQPQYCGKTLRAFCDEVHGKMRELGLPRLARDAAVDLPHPVMMPSAAYRALLRGEGELVPIAEMANRVSGVCVTPFPPGIPIVMQGERMGDESSAAMRLLLAIEAFDKAFPSLARDMHGIERDKDRNYFVRVLSEQRTAQSTTASSSVPKSMARTRKRART